MQNISELIALYRDCFPYLTRSEDVVRGIFRRASTKVIAIRNDDGELTAASVFGGGTVYMLAVKKEYRNRGIGSKLLSDTEALMKTSGVKRAVIGVGDDYIAPGVPTSVMPFYEEQLSASVDAGLTDEAARFFSRRGYVHSWKGCNCFDMRARPADLPRKAQANNPDGDSLSLRFAAKGDREAVCSMVRNAYQSFLEYYEDEAIYGKTPEGRAAIAETDGKIVGAVLVSLNEEAKGIGSVGCTAVLPEYRSRNIASRLVLFGTDYLWEHGMAEAFVGYTYSGLQNLYGKAGYKISAYYFMAEKEL
ncbi:MAG: GNAT family N-acetyltransferase [Eubacteriales bacterium]|nr:GNAT family N-acetyltransferase [Eubacteriales bacterium]MDD3883128.1 GNAT family N-acetyltransferase [Eubacteriales bacterium]MDD4512702.1 GNAT family N-acetyltransferase [Eubacteriales bacterium]